MPQINGKHEVYRRPRVLSPCDESCTAGHFHIVIESEEEYTRLYGQLFAWNWHDKRPPEDVHKDAVDESSTK